MTLKALESVLGQDRAVIHANSVAIGGRAVLIVGPSGSGKSNLSLQLMAYGAELVADDKVILATSGSRTNVSAPEAISGLIEARGMGILRASAAQEASLAAVVDLSNTETQRLPEPREVQVLNQIVPLFYNVATPHFGAAIIQFLKRGLVSSEWVHR